MKFYIGQIFLTPSGEVKIESIHPNFETCVIKNTTTSFICTSSFGFLNCWKQVIDLTIINL